MKKTLLLLFVLTAIGRPVVADDDTTRPTCEWLMRVGERCDSLMKAGDLEAAEQLMGHSLVRAAGIADSCSMVAYMFSKLASIYEQSGDTILPSALHWKSRSAMAEYVANQVSADSAQIIRQRFSILEEFIQQSAPLFTRDNLAYLEQLNNMVYFMDYCGNTLEVIYLGEKVLKLAADSLVSDHPVAGQCYAYLLAAYAWEGEMERVAELLPQARAFYLRNPDLNIDETALYYRIGDALALREDYAAALPYLSKALKAIHDKSDNRLQPLKELIKRCRKNS